MNVLVGLGLLVLCLAIVAGFWGAIGYGVYFIAMSVAGLFV